MDGCTAAPNTLCQEASPSLGLGLCPAFLAWALPGPWGWQGTVLLNNKCCFLRQ